MTSTHVEIVKGDLLTTSLVQCIFQQCNCLAVRPHGLSASIAKVYPYADVYGQRKAIGKRNLAQVCDQPQPGSCKIMTGDNGPSVACLFGQYQYGKSGRYQMGDKEQPDTPKDRESYFWYSLLDFHSQSSCLETPLTILGFPYKIGAGLAGGSWSAYYKMIVEFSNIYPEYKIYLFQLDQ